MNFSFNMFCKLGERGIHFCSQPLGIFWGPKGIYLLPAHIEELKKHLTEDFEGTVPLGPGTLLTTTVFEGHKLIHIRRYWDGRPTKIGIALRSNEVADLIKCF